ncbi:MAG: hypothetical protein CR217_15425 [Beijerinckiaceae bacterium]|nr:MAG: hypothetical protein CR217_15425 [Beijerinckiaceae bacterium]
MMHSQGLTHRIERWVLPVSQQYPRPLDPAHRFSPRAISSSAKSPFPIDNLIARRNAVMTFASFNESNDRLQHFAGQMNPTEHAVDRCRLQPRSFKRRVEITIRKAGLRTMDRRSVLQGSLRGVSSAIAERSTVGGAITAIGLLNGDGSAQARSAPATVLIPSLRKALDPRDATVLAPSESGFSTYQRYAAANLRVARRPAARVVIRTREGVAAAVNWLRDNGVPFAVRGGGHCYEAFSQNDAVVLDMRGMADVKIEDGGNRVSVGGGALLGQIYAALVDIGRIVPAGSCPQVGAAGHVLGGGYGMFARKYGLTCDSLIGVEIVDAKGRILSVSDTQEKDLFWALRGGGAGSFGVVTRLVYRTTQIASGTRFAIERGADTLAPFNSSHAIFLKRERILQITGVKQKGTHLSLGSLEKGRIQGPRVVSGRYIV